MKSHTIFIIIILLLLFRKKQAVSTVAPDYVTRAEFNDLAKKVGYLREEMDSQYFG